MRIKKAYGGNIHTRINKDRLPKLDLGSLDLLNNIANSPRVAGGKEALAALPKEGGLLNSAGAMQGIGAVSGMASGIISSLGQKSDGTKTNSSIIGSDILRGVGMGASFGPVGMAVGAGLGGIKSVFDVIGNEKLKDENAKRLKEEEELKRKIKFDADKAALDGINIHGNETNNIFAMGGNINKMRNYMYINPKVYTPLMMGLGGGINLPDGNSEQIDEDAVVATNDNGGMSGSHEQGDNIQVNRDGQPVAEVEPGEVIADINGKQIALSKRLGIQGKSFAELYMQFSNAKQKLQVDLSKEPDFAKAGTIKRNIDKIDYQIAMLPKLQEQMKPKEDGIQAACGKKLSDGGDIEKDIFNNRIRKIDFILDDFDGFGQRYDPFGIKDATMVTRPYLSGMSKDVLGKNKVVGTVKNPFNKELNLTDTSEDTFGNRKGTLMSKATPEGTMVNNNSNIKDDFNYDKIMNFIPFAGDIANSILINKLSKQRLPLPYKESTPILNKDLDVSGREKVINVGADNARNFIKSNTMSSNVATARNRDIELNTSSQLSKVNEDKINFKNEREMAQSQMASYIEGRNLDRLYGYKMNEDARLRDNISKQSQLFSKVGEHAVDAINRKDDIDYKNKYLDVIKAGYTNVADTLDVIGMDYDTAYNELIKKPGYTPESAKRTLDIMLKKGHILKSK